ncbi:MAG: hypothetical protein SNG35_00770, partial [Rikenellaceae bacterium]
GGGFDVIFCVDGRIQHGGLADRFYGAICTYALCKIFDTPFKLYYKYPFELSEFLEVNTYNWRIDESQIVYNTRNSCPVVLLGDTEWYIKAKHYIKYKSQSKQIHLYANVRKLDEINQLYNVAYTYAELYNELFKPSERLLKSLFVAYEKLPPIYNSMCFRFQNAFGDFKEREFKELPKDEQQQLLIKVHKDIREFVNKYQLPVVITADSHLFLNSLKNIDGVYTINRGLGNVHMDYIGNSSIDIYEQPFIDYHCLGKGEEIFCYKGKYNVISGFAFFAATLSNKERFLYPE